MIEILYCENGDHEWQRESKRGKKPKNCPNHTPTPAPKSAAVTCASCGGPCYWHDTEWVCERCGDEWNADHGPEYRHPEDKRTTRILVCEHDGHEWEAPVQRGRPPRFCPEHQSPKPLTARQRSGSLGKERANDFDLATAKTIEYLENDAWKEKAQREYEDPSDDPLCDFDDRSRTLIEKGNELLSTRELYCHAGNHTYQAERKRGKPPRDCPEHAAIGSIERKVELDQEKKEKAQKLLQDEIARLSSRVEDAEIVDRDAMSKLQAAGGVKVADEEFKIWLRANTALLHEVESLRARERKLCEL